MSRRPCVVLIFEDGRGGGGGSAGNAVRCHFLAAFRSTQADLLDVDVNGDSYFELYMVGVQYALGENGAVVMNYRAKFSGLN